MKILFYASSAYLIEDLGILMDAAIILSKEGHDVYFLYNNCSMGICTVNIEKRARVCAMCKSQMNKSLKLLPKSIHTINISKYWNAYKDYKYEYDSAASLKRVEYKGVKVGCAVLSSYITMTRNRSPKIDEQSKVFFDTIITATCRLTDAIEAAIDEIKPNQIHFFNARYFQWRPPYDLALSKHIDAVSWEHTYDDKRKSVKTVFHNSTPHNIHNYYKTYTQLWEEALVPMAEKERIGREFFEKRRKGIAAADRVYIGNQQKGRMPKDWDASKKNIVIFNSSDDEFAAVGDEYDSLSVFPTQYQGIRYILDATKYDKDIHVYLRIHPNLSKVPYRWHTELLKLSEMYDHITVIPGTDSISTYDLMDGAEKVVVFGSTMGAESAYWGKPVILLAGGVYYYSDICYKPKDKKELNKLLHDRLEPRDNTDAIKFGFYMLYRDPNMRYRYINFDNEYLHAFGREWLHTPFLKILGSSKLYAIYYRFLRRYFKMTSKDDPSWQIPWEEDPTAEI